MAEPHSAPTLQRIYPALPAVRHSGLSWDVERAIAIAKLQIGGSDPHRTYQGLLGGVPPEARSQSEQDGVTSAWLAPGEWLLTGSDAAIRLQLARIDDNDRDDVLAVDLTHAWTSFKLGGPEARTALAAHCPLDLSHEEFPTNRVARSLLGDTTIFIARLDDGSSEPWFRIIVDQTMAAYVARLFGGPRPRTGVVK